MKGIIIKVNEKNISEDMLIIDLKNIASAINSSTLSVKEYKDNGGKYGVTTFRRRFGSWNNALKKAKLVLNVSNIRYSRKQRYDNYIASCEKLGKQASSNGMKTSTSNVSLSTYENHFGSWNNFIKEFQNIQSFQS